MKNQTFGFNAKCVKRDINFSEKFLVTCKILNGRKTENHIIKHYLNDLLLKTTCLMYILMIQHVTDALMTQIWV